MILFQAVQFLAATALAAAATTTLSRRQSSSNTAVVDLSTNRGEPKHLAAGFIYGIPDNENQIPDHWFTNMGFEYNRGGGAQMGTSCFLFLPICQCELIMLLYRCAKPWLGLGLK